MYTADRRNVRASEVATATIVNTTDYL